jgi:hypothetical protein
MATQNNISDAVGSGVFEPFDRQPVGLLTVKHLKFGVAIEAFISLKDSQG